MGATAIKPGPDIPPPPDNQGAHRSQRQLLNITLSHKTLGLVISKYKEDLPIRLVYQSKNL